MKGLSNINTKEDVLNLIRDYPEEEKKELESLYADRFIWQTTGTLESLEQGINDETHRAFATKSEDGETEIFIQQEKVVDENAFIYRLGFTDEEVQALLA